jgi:cellulose 1,4-beta-cellobiosidase
MKMRIFRSFLVAAFILSLPSLARAQTPGSRSISLSWQPSVNATGYNIYKSQSACAGATFAKITPTPITAVTFTETGMADGVTRCYYITAVNATGESTPSGTIQVTTPVSTNPIAGLSPPASLTASSQ